MLICGLNQYYDPYKPHVQRFVTWEYDISGNLLHTNVINTEYRANYSTGLLQLADGNYFITGSCANQYGWQRNGLIKVDSKGNLIWSKMYEHGGGGVEPYIVTGFPNPDGSCLLLLSDDRGVGFLQINSNGEVIRHIPCRGYPYGMTVKQLDTNKSFYVNSYGEIVFVNLDGYLSR